MSVKIKEDSRDIKKQAVDIGQAELHTHLVRDDPSRIAEMKGEGYHAVTLDEIKNQGNVDRAKLHQDKDVFRRGDLILMAAPREVVERREQERIARNEEQGTRAMERMNREGGLENDREQHGQRRGGKFYSIP